jgi:glyoxylase-like metal-dependent hydrolase (beta-lactamase superfamily II)
MIIVDHITSGTIDTNGYVVGDPVTRKGMFIDAPERGAVRMLELAVKHGLTITYIVNTHGHWDHIPDNSALRKNTGAKVAVHTDDGHYLLNPTTLLFQLPFSIEPLVPDEYLSDNQILEIGSLKFIVLHTPGHTPGSICLYEQNEKVLFTGDTLFPGVTGTFCLNRSRNAFSHFPIPLPSTQGTDPHPRSAMNGLRILSSSSPICVSFRPFSIEES